jgi:subtilase family serine protease
VTWTGSDTLSGISGYEIGLDGRALKSVGTNSTYVLSGLDNGNHMVEVKALDNAGNQNDASVNFVVSTGSTGSIAIAATVIAVVAIILIATIYGVRKRRKT